ncbi:hypothetical protein Tco_0242320 [Tanacetum coccineum]
MSDSEDSTVSYTEVSSPFEDLSDIGSPGVDGLPMMLEDPYVEAALQDPPSPDYVPGPEHPPLPVYVPYVPEPVYPAFMPPEDDFVPEEDPEEDDEEDPTDRDDDNDEEEESFGDDANDEEEDKDEEEEEKEHLVLTNSVPPPACRTTARMSIWDQTPIPFPPVVEVDRFLAISTPPPSPLTPYSSPLPQIPSPPLLSRVTIYFPSTIILPHTRASVAMMRTAAPSTYILASQSKTPPSGTPPLLPIPLPTLSPHLLLLSTVCRAGVSEVMLPPRKRLCIALGSRFKVGKSSSAPTARPTGGFRADYRFVNTLDDEIRRDPKRKRMIDFVTTVRQDTNKIYGKLDDVLDDRSLMSGQLNMLRRDRRAHAHTARLMETEARLSHKAWVQSMDASDIAHSEVRALQTTVLAHQTETHPIGTTCRDTNTNKATADTCDSTLESAGTASGPTQPDVPVGIYSFNDTKE